MTREELEIFYLYDHHDYLVKNNHNLKKIIVTLKSYSNEDIQQLINKLISWYTVKYSDVFLDSLLNDKINTDKTILEIMNFDSLKRNFSTFEELFFQKSDANDDKIILQKNLIVMAGWGMIYHKNSNPEYGFYRACKLLDDFNSEYSWHLSSNIYAPVFERDYSPNLEANKKLLEKHKKKHDKLHKKKKKRKRLFH